MRNIHRIFEIYVGGSPGDFERRAHGNTWHITQSIASASLLLTQLYLYQQRRTCFSTYFQKGW